MSQHLDYEINKELGECYLFMGELDKASEYYSKAAKSNGVHPDPYLGLATIAVQRGELDEAMTLYRKAHSIEPTDKSLSGIALILMEHGESTQAFDLFVEALGLNPANMVALFSLVRLGHELNRLSDVVVHLENYLQVNPAKSEVRYALAGCLVCLDRREEAVHELKTILEADPENGPAKELLAQF